MLPAPIFLPDVLPLLDTPGFFPALALGRRFVWSVVISKTVVDRVHADSFSPGVGRYMACRGYQRGGDCASELAHLRLTTAEWHGEVPDQLASSDSTGAQ